MRPDDMATLQHIAEHASVFEVTRPTPDGPTPITVCRAMQMDGSVLWAVRKSGSVLSRAGRWEWEPSPSNRDDDFLARCRFPTLTEAWAAALKAGSR